MLSTVFPAPREALFLLKNTPPPPQSPCTLTPEGQRLLNPQKYLAIYRVRLMRAGSTVYANLDGGYRSQERPASFLLHGRYVNWVVSEYWYRALPLHQTAQKDIGTPSLFSFVTLYFVVIQTFRGVDYLSTEDFSVSRNVKVFILFEF